jgi:hypothetical protein
MAQKRVSSRENIALQAWNFNKWASPTSCQVQQAKVIKDLLYIINLLIFAVVSWYIGTELLFII